MLDHLDPRRQARFQGRGILGQDREGLVVAGNDEAEVEPFPRGPGGTVGAEIAREGIACRLLINSQPRMSLGLFSAGVQFFFHEFHQCRTPFGRIAVGCQQAADTAATIDAQTFCIILGGNTPGIVVAGQYIAAHADLLQALQSVKSCDPKQGGLVPVWYLLADDNGTPRCYLSGASIGRVMQGRGWAEIMGSYAPCADIDALCPGCALFGTVKGKGTSGRVRFTDAEAAQYESLGNKTLPILSGPKPSAYEFYLEKPKSTYETSIGFWNYDFCSLEETKCSPDGTKQTIK